MLQKIIAKQLALPKGFLGWFTGRWLNRANKYVNQGALLLCFDTKEDLKLWPGHRYGFRLFESAQLEALLTASGFQVVETALESNGKLGRFYCMLARKPQKA